MSMQINELEYKEAKLRECFMDALEGLDVDGLNEYCTIKHIKTIGALWHYTHQLLLAMQHETKGYTTTTDTMDIQATGLKMTGGR